jgi:hypothetical protein
MPFNPPLALAELRAIQDRHRGPDGKIRDPDVLALLMEVKRYRSFVLRTKQLAGELRRPSGVLAPVYDEWWDTLTAEPCIAEQEQMVRELLAGPAKLRKGMTPR